MILKKDIKMEKILKAILISGIILSNNAFSNESSIKQDIQSIIDESKLKQKNEKDDKFFFNNDPYDYKSKGISPELYVKHLGTNDVNKKLFIEYSEQIIYIVKNYNNSIMLTNYSDKVFQNVICLKLRMGDSALEHLQYLAALTLTDEEMVSQYKKGSVIINIENKKYRNTDLKRFINYCEKL
jgi:hypothetical protein